MITLIRFNRILAIALVTVFAASVVTIAQFSNNSLQTSLYHLVHDIGGIASSVDDDHAVEAAAYPLSVTQLSDIKVKEGDDVVVYEDYIDSVDDAIQCESCIRIEYTPGRLGQAGLALAFDKIKDLSKAKSVTFYAMGDNGGEKMKIKVAGQKITNDKDSSLVPPGPLKQHKFGLTSEEVKLKEKRWQKFSIDLSSIPTKDLAGVTHPFAIEISTQKDVGKQIIYIKGIFYNSELDEKPSIERLATIK